MGAVKGLLKLVIWVGVPTLAIAGLLQYFFVDRMAVGHDAMAPTIFAGETIFVWRDAEPNLGRVVICDHPRRPGNLVIGRVIAIPGMTVSSERNELVVSGRRPAKDVVAKVSWRDPTTGRSEPVIYGDLQLGNMEHGFFEPESGVRLRSTEIRRRGVYLLGDNRAAEGQDSRYFGPVDPGTCRGRVVLRVGRSDTAPSEVDRPLVDFL